MKTTCRNSVLLSSAAVLVALSTGRIAAADYPTTIQSFNPVAYYRLNETAAVPAANFTVNSGSLGAAGNGYIVADVTNALRSLMVRKMGIVRDRQGLLEAERDVAFWCRYALTRGFTSRDGWELQNLLTIARLMIDSALQREESRGVHFRSDFPKRDDVPWQRHLTCAKTSLR